MLPLPFANEVGNAVQLLAIVAAEALMLVGPTPADVPMLVKVSKDSTSGAKEAAARALGQIGSGAKDAVPRLIDMLSDRDQDVRMAAAESLGRIGLPAAAPAIPKLKDAVRADPNLATAARKALDRLGNFIILKRIFVRPVNIINNNVASVFNAEINNVLRELFRAFKCRGEKEF